MHICAEPEFFSSLMISSSCFMVSLYFWMPHLSHFSLASTITFLSLWFLYLEFEVKFMSQFDVTMI